MSWIDITRNIRDSNNLTGQFQRIVRDIFTLNGVLYAIVAIQTREPVTYSTKYKYSVYKHLGADPPVVDVIWDYAGDFFPMAHEFKYRSAGKAELNGYIYIGNSVNSQIYVNTTVNTINGNWRVINGPYGRAQYTDVDAYLSSIIVYNGVLYAGHRGGISKYDEETRTWILVGSFTQGPLAVGDTKALYVFQSELYAGISYINESIVYKWNESITDVTRWIKVAALPSETLGIAAITEYQNELMVIAKSPNKNIFHQRDIANNFRGNLQFLEGDHLKGIPVSATSYKRTPTSTSGIWVSCTDYESSITNENLGDLNADGIIDADDISAMISAVTDHDAINPNKTNWPYSINSADFTGDNNIGVTDLILLGRYITLGKEYMISEGHIEDSLYDTRSRNKIIEISEDINEVDLSDVTFNWDGFSYDNTYRQWDTDSNLTTGIIFSVSQGSPFNNTATGGNFQTSLDSLNSNIVLYSNDIGTSAVDPSVKYVISFDIETIVYIRGEVQDPRGSAKFIPSSSIVYVGVSREKNGDKNTGFYSTSLLEPVKSIRLPYLTSDAGGMWIGNVNPFTYTVPGNILANLDGPVYLKISVHDDVTNALILNNAATPSLAAYAPEFKFSNFKIKNLGGITLGSKYIKRKLEDVPTEEVSNHTVIGPSGPDDFFIRSSGIVNNYAPTLRLLTELPTDIGSITRPYSTNIITFEPGESYIFRMSLYLPPRVDNISFTPSDTGINTTIYIQAEDSNGVSFLNHTSFYSWDTEARPEIGIPFDIPDGPSSIYKDISVKFGARRYSFDPIINFRSYNSPDIYFSDINITKVIQGSPSNYVYKYTGAGVDKWASIATSVADPPLYSTIPRYSLTTNYDLRSDADQLYSIGGGKVWVWHYDGGLYSGSASGISFDKRPQVISIM